MSVVHTAVVAPSRWKMCILTIPTVYFALNVVRFSLSHLIPGFVDWSVQVQMIPITCIMTVLLTYVCLPALSKLFAPWLYSRVPRRTTQTLEPLNS